MALTIPRPRIGGSGFYIVLFVVSIVAWLTQHSLVQLTNYYRQPSPGGFESQITDLSGVQNRQLDAYLAVNGMLTTFGTTLLGALGFLLFGRQKASTWRRHLWAAWAGILCVTTSIFFGYVAYLFVQWMLAWGLFDLTTKASLPHWGQQAHFYTFLAGVVFLADFAYHNLNTEGT
jgi:hypothetical protein